MIKKGIEVKILRKNFETAQLEIEKQKIIINSKLLPETAKEGKSIKLYFLDSEEEVKKDKKLAKMILEEILNGK